MTSDELPVNLVSVIANYLYALPVSKLFKRKKTILIKLSKTSISLFFVVI